MKISNKLYLSFFVLIMAVAIVGYFSVKSSQKTLEETIGTYSSRLCQEVIDTIDMNIYNRIIEVQSFAMDNTILDSIADENKRLSSIPDIENYIEENDSKWIISSKDNPFGFIEEIISRPVSKDLLEKLKFYNNKSGYNVFSEIFVTSNLGTVVGMTDKTTDYYQKDEFWWEETRRKSPYVSDVTYDESSNVFSTDIHIKIDDKDGEFLGEIKAVLNIEDVINIITEAERSVKYQDPIFTLLNKKGEIIYSTGGHRYHNKGEGLEAFIDSEGKKSGYCIMETSGEVEKLFSFAHSVGYKENLGFGWTLVSEYESATIFKEVISFKKTIAIIVVVILIFSILASILIARSITSPITKLIQIMKNVGKGKIVSNIKISANNEIGVLLRSFKEMSKNLEIYIEKEKELAAKTAALDVEKKRTDEIKKAYQKLQEMQDLLVEAEKYNSIGQVAGGVAHEVRNPLGSILLGINYLEKNGDNMNEEEKEKTITMLKKNIEKADKIVETLLDFSKNQKLSMDSYDINDILNSCLLLVNPKMEDKNISKVKEFGKKIPKVMVDKNKMEQVFVNILLNAIKAVDKNGTIYLRTYKEKNTTSLTSPSSGNENIVVEIEDNGRGIAKENLLKVFEPFFTTYADSGGTGLGLSVCNSIVLMHKGTLKITSELNKGTKVAIMLKPA